MVLLSDINMLSRTFVISVLLLTFVVLNLNQQTEARYLPTRSNGDRLDKLRELLKEVRYTSGY